MDQGMYVLTLALMMDVLGSGDEHFRRAFCPQLGYFGHVFWNKFVVVY